MVWPPPAAGRFPASDRRRHRAEPDQSLLTHAHESSNACQNKFDLVRHR
jgi:hypothetical protein